MIRSKIRRRKSGAVILVVLVCLAVAMTLIVGWAQIAASQVRQARSAEDRLQAVWLAESALGRAAALLSADPTYQGETWQVAADQFGRDSHAGPPADGLAVISVEAVEGNAGSRLVKVQADYPATGTHTNRVSKQVIVTLPNRGGTP